MWWEISNQRAAICWHWKWQKRLQIWHRHRNLRTKKWSAETIQIDFVTMDWPSLEKNMTWSNHLILITPNLRTRPDHKEECQDQATTCRIEGTEFWNGRGIRRAWQSGSLAVTLNKCAMQIVFFVLSSLSYLSGEGGKSVLWTLQDKGLAKQIPDKTKIGVESNCSTSKRIDSKRFPTSCSDCDAWPQRELRVASCVVLSCLPCCFFCLRSEGRILRVRCRCSRIGTSSNWENARNRWHQDLAQSEKPQSFQV